MTVTRHGYIGKRTIFVIRKGRRRARRQLLQLPGPRDTVPGGGLICATVRSPACSPPSRPRCSSPRSPRGRDAARQRRPHDRSAHGPGHGAGERNLSTIASPGLSRVAALPALQLPGSASRSRSPRPPPSRRRPRPRRRRPPRPRPRRRRGRRPAAPAPPRSSRTSARRSTPRDDPPPSERPRAAEPALDGRRSRRGARRRARRWCVANRIAADPAGGLVGRQGARPGPARLKVSSDWAEVRRPPTLPGLAGAPAWTPYAGLDTTVSVALCRPPTRHCPERARAEAEGGLPHPRRRASSGSRRAPTAACARAIGARHLRDPDHARRADARLRGAHRRARGADLVPERARLDHGRGRDAAQPGAPTRRTGCARPRCQGARHGARERAQGAAARRRVRWASSAPRARSGRANATPPRRLAPLRRTGRRRRGS